jgi:hypothetical protein
VDALTGSAVLPALIPVGAHEVRIDDLVAHAHAVSGMSVEEWNELETLVRESWIIAVILHLREESSPVVVYNA